MKSTTTRRWRGLLAFGTLGLSVAGCEAQVGPDYQGESLFTLQGNVVLAGDGRPDVIPVIAFAAGFEYAVVDATVRGDFPAQFRLDVMVPPPSGALVPLEGGGSAAFGRVALAPSHHPDYIPVFLSHEVDDCNEAETHCTREVEKCVSEDRCFKRTLSCKRELCPIVFESGEPSVEEDVETAIVAVYPRGEFSYGVAESCSPSAGCHRTIRQCEVAAAGPYAITASGGTLDTCEVLAESGDLSIAQSDLLEHVATDYFVLYLTEATTLERIGELPRGYHLFETVRHAPEDVLRNLNCEYDAHITAVSRHNQEHGTDYLPHDDFDADEEAIEARTDELAAECPPADPLRLVPSPADTPLTFVIGSADTFYF